jgi:hypothetical protein
MKRVVDKARAARALANLDALEKSFPHLVDKTKSGPHNTKDWEHIMAREKIGPAAPLRLTEEILERVETYAERMRKENPGVNYTRSDALRRLILVGLDVVEAEKPKGKR